MFTKNYYLFVLHADLTKILTERPYLCEYFFLKVKVLVNKCYTLKTSYFCWGTILFILTCKKRVNYECRNRGYIQTELMTCVSAENVKIEYFFKKIFNSYAYVSGDNDTMKIQKEIEYVNSHILENIVK